MRHENKYWLVLVTVILVGLYIFEPTHSFFLSKTAMELKLEFAPFFSVKNIVSIILIWLSYKIFVAGR